jgi:hypothetical protein
MGRTIPSFRIAEAQEAAEWRSFRKALPPRDRAAFDEIFSSARLYISASSAAVRTSKFEGMAMAMIFHHHKLLMRAVAVTSRMEPKEGEDDPL